MPREADREALRGELVEAGVAGIVERGSQVVEMADYAGGLAEIPLPELGLRFLEGDPRLDAWTQGLDGYFQARIDGSEREVWYLRRGLWGADPGRLGTTLERHGALLAASASPPIPVQARLLVGALALGLFILGSLRKRGRSLALALGLPWILYGLFAPGGWIAFSGAAALPFTAPAIAGIRSRFRPGSWAANPLLPSVLFVLFPLASVIALEPSALLPFLLCTIASLASSLASLEEGRAGERKRFEALPILRPRRTGISSLPPLTLVARALLGLLALSSVAVPVQTGLFAPGTAGSVVLPLPLRGPAPGQGAAEGQLLPGLEEYRHHLEVQRGFFERSLRNGPDPAIAVAPSPAPGARGEAASPGSGLLDLLRAQGSGTRAAMGVLAESPRAPLASLPAILYIVSLSLFVVVALRVRLVGSAIRSRREQC